MSKQDVFIGAGRPLGCWAKVVILVFRNFYTTLVSVGVERFVCPWDGVVG